jgi:MoaA/NifB/PqqE/SkfB family radical SAM enzyme
LTAVYWDITGRCNARCLYCSARHARRHGPPSDAPPETVLAALPRLRAAGADTVVFLGGEPTLREDLPALAREALRCGLQVGIATNGQALGRRLRRELLDLGPISINVSLDSARAAENDAVRGPGYHARARATLRAVLAERRAADAPARVTIQATLTRANLARLEESLLGLVDLGVDSVLVDRMRDYPWQPPEVRALAPGPEQWIAGAESVARAAARLGAPGRVALNYGHARLKARLAARHGFAAPAERFCPGGLRAAVVDLRGFLHPCRNVLERPVPARPDGEPWFAIRPVRVDAPEAAGFLRSPYFTGFFNFAHSAGVYESLGPCRACPHYASCEPCPLDAATFGERALAECRCLGEIESREGSGR